MAIQKDGVTHPEYGDLEDTVYVVVPVDSIQLTPTTGTYDFKVWVSKQARDEGKRPIYEGTRTITGAGLNNLLADLRTRAYNHLKNTIFQGATDVPGVTE